MSKPVDPRTDIGHVHLKVADLDRALAFYNGVLGFTITQRMGTSAAFLSAGGYHHHIGLNTWESHRGTPPAPGTTGLYHFAIRYADRAALGDALRRLHDAGVRLDGASDHGVSEALYLRDPDGNGIELYWDRPRDQWPRAADGTLRMVSEPLDLPALLAAAEPSAAKPSAAKPSAAKPSAANTSAAKPSAAKPSAANTPPMSEAMRQRLRDLRLTLLQLHKVLLDDARATYEMDRGRVGSNASLLQLVINDPWFAWLHSVSELVVRIDETVDNGSVASDGDATALMEQVERLLTASESGEGFQRRYFDALQRQPAVVLAHAAVRQVLKEGRR